MHGYGWLRVALWHLQVNQDRQQQEANQEKNEQNVQNMEQQQRDAQASSPSGRRLQQSSPSPVTQQDVDNKVHQASHEQPPMESWRCVLW